MDKQDELAAVNTWQQPYADAGHDVTSVFAHPYNCKDCGSAQIDLSEDLAYGDMRKCARAALPAAIGEDIGGGRG